MSSLSLYNDISFNYTYNITENAIYRKEVANITEININSLTGHHSYWRFFLQKKVNGSYVNLVDTDLSSTSTTTLYSISINDPSSTLITGSESNSYGLKSSKVAYIPEVGSFSNDNDNTKIVFNTPTTILFILNYNNAYPSDTLKIDLSYQTSTLSPPTIYKNTPVHFNNKINIPQPIEYSFATTNDYQDISAGQHINIYNNVRGFRINKLHYRLNNNTNSYSRIYLQLSDSIDDNPTTETNYNLVSGDISINETDAAFNKSFNDLFGGSDTSVWGSVQTRDLDNEDPFMWIKPTDESYTILFNETKNIKLTLSSYYNEKMILDIVPLFVSNITETILNNIPNKDDIKINLFSNPTYSLTKKFKVPQSKFFDNNLSGFTNINIINNILYKKRTGLSVDLKDISENEAFYSLIENNQTFDINISNDLSLHVLRNDASNNNTEAYFITNLSSISQNKISISQASSDYYNMFVPGDYIEITDNDKRFKFYFNSIAGGQEEVVTQNICFYENTLIKTDQGDVEIKKLNQNTHTINNKQIKKITTSTISDDTLVCFTKHSLGYNKPDKDLIITCNHEILFNGKLIQAGEFASKNIKINNLYSNKHSKGINFINYNNELLYNILMDKHEIIYANNVECETLDPKNINANIYLDVNKYEDQRFLFNLINNKNSEKGVDIINNYLKNNTLEKTTNLIDKYLLK